LPDFLAWPLARLEKFGLLILVGLIFILPYVGNLLGINLDVFNWIVWTPVEWLLPWFDRIAGIGWLGS
jgi:hypothetical protein